MKTGTASGQAAKGRPCWLAAALMTTTLAGLGGHAASAATAQTLAAPAPSSAQSFNIPAQKLGDALATFGAQSGWQVSVRADVIRSANSPGVSGSLTPADALSRLLAGTGFTYRLSGGHTVTLVPASTNITLGPVRVGGTVAHQDPTGPGVGYFAENTLSGTKTDTPIMEIPNSIYVITKQEMVDQQPQNIREALRYAPGVVTGTGGMDGTGASVNDSGDIMQRGFTTTQFVDGLRSTSQAAGETAFVDRVEVVNGPASVMYGQVTPGGMVGMSLKSPTQTAFHQVSLGFGNWGRYEATFDTSDKITKSGNVRYRIAGIGVTQGTQIDHVDYHRVGILPSISWDIDEKTSLTILGSYMYTPGTGATASAQYPIQGTLFTNDFPQIPRSNFLGFTNWNEESVKDAMFEYKFKHDFSQYIKFTQTFRWEKSDRHVKEAINDGSVSSSDVSDQYYYADYHHTITDTVGMDARLFGKFSTGPIHHTWVVGSDFRQYNNNFQSTTSDVEDSIINVYNPGATKYTPCFNINSHSGCANDLEITKYGYFQEGVYFQDQLKWKGITLIAGGRQDWVNTTTNGFSYSNDNSSNTKKLEDTTHKTQPQSAFTWRSGLTYQFNFGLAPYFSYSTSFVPQTATDYNGQPFAPLTGSQYEAGLKYRVPNHDIMVTASAFHILENHYSIKDMQHSGYSTDAGTVKSQGFEVSVNGNITKQLRLVASYSFTDARFAKNNRTAKRVNPYTGETYGNAVSYEGMSVPYIPRNMASIFINYEIPKSFIKGISVNGGIRYMGSSYAGYVESFKSPAYLLFDIGANYDFGTAMSALKGLKAQLAISNLTNKYYVSSCDNYDCYVGQGRRVYGNLTYNW
ncbi:TonB-dependent siderophore receptor [Komagataeibacter sp. NFXK3]